MTTTSIQFDLGRGERLLWSGAPRRGVVFRRSDLFMVPFSLLWAGFAVFWEATAIASGAPFFFALWGIPFVLVGLYMVAGRFWADARRRARTSYGLTTERVIIATASSLESLSLRTLGDVTLEQRPDGTGTITFGAGAPFTALYAGTPWPGMQQPPSFELVSGAREVYDRIREAQRALALQAAPPPPPALAARGRDATTR